MEVVSLLAVHSVGCLVGVITTLVFLVFGYDGIRLP